MPSEAAKKGPHQGKLIAMEGARGPDVMAAARRLCRQLTSKSSEAGISPWGASNLFVELRLGTDEDEPGPSPRTLLLLYASDLAFRLRWEIKPALAEGQCVIAAPYIETAMAFGKAAGLKRRWLAELFRFAPRPDICYRARDRRDVSALGKPSDGFLEFCAAALKHDNPPWDPVVLRRRFEEYLDGVERRGGCQTFTEKLLAAVGGSD